MNTHGKEYKLICTAEGSFADPVFPACREAENCSGPLLVPPESSKMENSTTDLATLKEWDEAVYKCTDSSHVVGKETDILKL
jgi:hypothetical protein